jgi:hypothetical protein
MGRNARLSTLAGGQKEKDALQAASPVLLERLPPTTPEKSHPLVFSNTSSLTASPTHRTPLHRRVASHTRTPRAPSVKPEEEHESAPLYVLVTTYLSYLVLILFGHLRDFFGKIFRAGEYAYLKMHNVGTSRGGLIAERARRMRPRMRPTRRVHSEATRAVSEPRFHAHYI